MPDKSLAQPQAAVPQDQVETKHKGAKKTIFLVSIPIIILQIIIAYLLVLDLNSKTAVSDSSQKTANEIADASRKNSR